MKFQIVCCVLLASVVAAIAQITVSLPGPGPSFLNVVPYCVSVGYPVAPTTGMTHWYKADTYSPCSATAETAWTDSSGNSNTSTFVTGTFTCNSNQINGHNGLAVSGTPKATMTQGTSGPQTVFVVFNLPTIANSTGYAFLGNTSTGGNLEYRIAGTGSGIGRQQILQEGLTLLFTGTINITQNVWHQVMFRNGPTNGALLHLDTATDLTGGWSSLGGANDMFTNGGNGGEYFIGTMAELIYYSGVELTPAQSLSTECYLYGKYGI